MASHQRLMSIFDIMGPIMTGPSSSHTAGAVRIGQMARMLFGTDPKSVDLYFYGSLAETYRGHMTDAGVVAGILSMEVDDPHIREALETARKRGIDLRIHTQTRSDKNPNTIEIEMASGHQGLHVSGVTVGGGEVIIERVGEVAVSLCGDKDILLVSVGRAASSDSAFSKAPVEKVRQVLAKELLSEEISQGPDQDLVSFELCRPASPEHVQAAASVQGVLWARSMPSLYDYNLRDSRPLFLTFQEMLDRMEMDKQDFPEIVADYEGRRSGLSKSEVRERMKRRWYAMRDAMDLGLNENLALIGGIASGDDAKRLRSALETGKLVSGKVLSMATLRALAVAELNASMGRVVAAPTAGAAGVIPGVVMTLAEELGSDEVEILDALLVASMIGVLIGNRAPVSGALGGCQSEVGVASAMAAGAAVQLKRRDAETVLNAMSFALMNVLGLVCDPVAGPVEVPCIHRNVIGVANALSAADLALAGIRSVIPPDEVVDALRNVQTLLPMELRDTTLGGLGCTKTALRLKQQWLERMKSG